MTEKQKRYATEYIFEYDPFLPKTLNLFLNDFLKGFQPINGCLDRFITKSTTKNKAMLLSSICNFGACSSIRYDATKEMGFKKMSDLATNVVNQLKLNTLTPDEVKKITLSFRCVVAKLTDEMKIKN